MGYYVIMVTHNLWVPMTRNTGGPYVSIAALFFHPPALHPQQAISVISIY
jgi:hypothetical protein